MHARVQRVYVQIYIYLERKAKEGEIDVGQPPRIIAGCLATASIYRPGFSFPVYRNTVRQVEAESGRVVLTRDLDFRCLSTFRCTFDSVTLLRYELCSSKISRSISRSGFCGKILSN